jgi:hypothetical protein
MKHKAFLKKYSLRMHLRHRDKNQRQKTIGHINENFGQKKKTYYLLSIKLAYGLHCSVAKYLIALLSVAVLSSTKHAQDEINHDI